MATPDGPSRDQLALVLAAIMRCRHWPIVRAELTPDELATAMLLRSELGPLNR